MSSDFDVPSPGQRITTYCCDSQNRLVGEGGLPLPVLPETTAYIFSTDVPTVPFTFEHDKEKRLFVLTGADGKTEHFRDNPTRHLLVEPAPISGRLRPVIKNGKPAYIYLCREEISPRKGQ
jgi:hypothetical protein